MNFRPVTICSCLLLLGLNSCRNDLELNAPYKEIPSIYAVLNPLDSIHTIRINKVFLGEGDANVMAKVADSVNYASDEITVTLERYRFGKQEKAGWKSQVVTFKEETITTNPGAFSTTQKVYVAHEKLYPVGDYVLTVKNNRTGNVFIGRAASLDSVPANGAPRPFSGPPYEPYPTPPPPLEEYMDYALPNGKFAVRFLTNKAKLYQLIIRVWYTETNAAGTRKDFVDYSFSPRNESQKEQFNATTSFIKYEFTDKEFFTAIGVGMARKNPPDNVNRKVYRIEYHALATTQEYADYLLYNSPSFGINQQPPIYSNFDNKAAIGIFTFRTVCVVPKEPASTMVNEFSRNPNTCAYKFLASDGTYLGCQ